MRLFGPPRDVGSTSRGSSRRSLHRRWRDLRAQEGARAALIAMASTVVFFTVVVWAVLSSPTWPKVQKQFFSGAHFAQVWPDVLAGFWLDVKMFLVAEVLILVISLIIAVTRSLQGPVFFPLRILAVGYTDLIRGIPLLLLLLLLGFGVPALGLHGVPSSPVFWAVASLVISYSAYTAEVYRAGIESVHPSQRAAARSLALSQGQAMRYVVLPQAVRNVIPPLLNGFVSLQKDVALVSILGAREAVREAQIYAALNFNNTGLVAAALLFLAVSVPLARFTDWYSDRDRRRRSSGMLV
ncbi:MAG TPA: amino acid ABC transporter permease [Actinobacteria bacterium]|nr:amino acid ABC transporter permease [Actinomycetota bacterium]